MIPKLKVDVCYLYHVYLSRYCGGRFEWTLSKPGTNMDQESRRGEKQVFKQQLQNAGRMRHS
jgi:hypothetical protein